MKLPTRQCQRKRHWIAAAAAGLALTMTSRWLMSFTHTRHVTSY